MAATGQTELIQALHDAPAKACLVVTGAGTSAISALFSVAGASRTVIDAQIPYSRAALDEYVGVQAHGHVSAAEARLMATKAHEHASRMSDQEASIEELIGLSCTAAIATDRVRRGANRCYVASFNGHQLITYSLVLNKGARSRVGEEDICKTLILNALAEAFGIESRLELRLNEDEFVERTAG